MPDFVQIVYDFVIHALIVGDHLPETSLQCKIGFFPAVYIFVAGGVSAFIHNSADSSYEDGAG